MCPCAWAEAEPQMQACPEHASALELRLPIALRRAARVSDARRTGKRAQGRAGLGSSSPSGQAGPSKAPASGCPVPRRTAASLLPGITHAAACMSRPAAQPTALNCHLETQWGSVLRGPAPFKWRCGCRRLLPGSRNCVLRRSLRTGRAVPVPPLPLHVAWRSPRGQVLQE